jgi:predicted nucleotidyltransferase
MKLRDKVPLTAPRRRILKEMATQLDDRLAGTTLSEAERNAVRRFAALMDDALGDDLRGLWLYGSRARGEVPREDSDVDLLVIAEGDRQRRRRLAMDLSEAAALAEDESPFTYSVHVHDEEWLRDAGRSNRSSLARWTATRSCSPGAPFREPSLQGIPGAG